MKKHLNTEKNRIQWVLMNMTQAGSSLTETQIKNIINGQVVREAEIAEHIAINSLMEALSLGEKLLELREEFCIDTLRKVYKCLSGKEGRFRKSTPVLYHLSYNPVLPQEIEDELKILFRKVSNENSEDPVIKAEMIHNGIMRIYPFPDWNEELARFALEYVLLYYDEEFIPITLNEQEYNSGIMDYLRMGKNRELDRNLRMNLLMIKNREPNNL